MHFGSTHRMPIYLAHTLNLETGQVQQEPPQGHWYDVMLLLPVRWVVLLLLLWCCVCF
jgi:hypothetical protein